MQNLKVKTITKNLKLINEVYKIVEKIPRGRVTTYGAISKIATEKFKNKKIKKLITPRMVGRALHINPDPKNIPCHRVVDRNGRLAYNFAFGGWREQKMKLLAEGIKFKKEMQVDLKKYLMRTKTPIDYS
ncbi:hypothetical protein A2159_01035 [Candidatus Woesebacteria bacterium RBG_13_34_9]|uniref:Methylated-DNA-[protein]-cysteine S-methyltransferase DNA binding domain-containing protein n=1 Tax=Candidatus Woesebacteria bacterium RBG_13_34_9 TaxID=1802477 RepID=A0A1F7X6G5_9BACT|nr:MAG: hypothetical protein A2159_01035 [Candidatus Woesebacteria bacterium RBG_13_34_9]